MYVAEIFKSIHGEVNGQHQGRLVGFVRLSGCNLHCFYCDTPETINAYYGSHMSVIEIVKKVAQLDVKHVCITGGEPLLKIDKLLTLLEILTGMGISISIETNGTMDVRPLFNYVDSLVVDYKFEFSDQMRMSNFYSLRKNDVTKFVVKDFEQFRQACLLSRQFEAEGSLCIMALSPLESELNPSVLANWMIDSGQDNLLLSLQIHKRLDLK